MADKKPTKGEKTKGDIKHSTKIGTFLKNIRLKQSRVKDEDERAGLLQGGRPKLATRGWK